MQSRWPLIRAWGVLVAKLLLVFGGVSAGFGGVALLLATTGGDVPVPSLSGIASEQAETMLRRQHLHMKVAWRRPSESAAAGTVLWQKPSAGTLVRKDRNVTIGVSAGPDSAVLPDLVGLPARQAELVVQQLGLSVGTRASVSCASLPGEAVVAQAPSAGTRVKSGSALALLVNLDKASLALRMPSIVGRRLPDANRLLRQLQLPLADLKLDPQAAATPGRIAVQSPPAGSRVVSGDSVTLTLAPLAEGARAKLLHFHYDVPQGGGARRVRVVLVDESGIREVMSEMADAGSAVDKGFTVQGDAVAEVYLNNQFTREVRLTGAAPVETTDEEKG